MKKLFLVSFIFVLIFSSCEEKELKLPASVTLQFDMEDFSVEDNSKAGQGFFIDRAYFVMNTLELDGIREQGDDYFFSRAFNTPVQAEMHTGNASEEITFDIPQGVYKKIELNLSLGDNEHPSIWLEGTFERGPFDNIPVLFQYTLKEEISVRAENRNGERQIILKKDTPASATIKLNVPFMFQLLNAGQIRNAESYPVEGEDILIINKDKNTEIFNLLATRLDKSLQVVFE
ncbi:MAG: hypothetical protein K9J25_05610 [Bacteroidales bacterium]|nr:hypothetical protein [Bacteroidales bacterium]